MNDKELASNIARGWFTFVSPWWDNISIEAKDLVSGLLQVNPRARYTMDQVLNHPWILGEKLDENYTYVDHEWILPSVLQTPMDLSDSPESYFQGIYYLCTNRLNHSLSR